MDCRTEVGSSIERLEDSVQGTSTADVHMPEQSGRNLPGGAANTAGVVSRLWTEWCQGKSDVGRCSMQGKGLYHEGLGEGRGKGNESRVGIPDGRRGQGYFCVHKGHFKNMKMQAVLIILSSFPAQQWK